MIVRVRSRDGVERVEVAERGSVEHLHTAVSTQLGIPYPELHLSKDPKLLLFGASPSQFSDLAKKGMTLKMAGVENGTMVFALYSGERHVPSSYQKSKFEGRLFGTKMTIDEMVAQQIRIERQAKAVAASVSFDHNAANAFQAYVRSVLGFSIKRGGLLYGWMDEENNVKVEFVYEPQQHATGIDLLMERQTEEELLVNCIAENLGLKKVGWIFAQSSEKRDFIVSAGELKQMAAIQTEIGDSAITAIVSLDTSAEEGHVHFEVCHLSCPFFSLLVFQAYQCSKQCVDLYNRQWFADDTESNVGVMQMQHPENPKDKTPVIVAGKDVGEVDNDFFLCPVNILDHQGSLTCTFPIENRLLSQGKKDLKEALANSRGDYRKKLSDFHLLLYLAGKLDRSDLLAICHSIQNNEPIMEGYQFLIDSLAGL